LLGARDPEVRRLRRLLRRRRSREEEGAYVVEGSKLVAEALAASAPVQAVFTGPETPPGLLERARDAGVPVRGLAPGVLERVASTVTPQPALAVLARADADLASLASASFVVVCVSLADPGNAGTVLRCAEAAGAGAVVFCGESVDVYNPKAVRASAGSLFYVPVVVAGDAVEVLERLAAFGLERLAAVTRDGRDHTTADLTGRLALVLGNEATGLPARVARAVDQSVSIRVAGRAESLNVAMAAAVLCFEVARQRRVEGRRG
jgi:TrmH family RNA methyltransferase